MRHVEKYVVGTRGSHFGLNSAGDHIARGEFARRTVAVHKARALDVLQHAAFASHGLGKQELGRSLEKERGGMKLNELHIHERGTRPVGHCHAVTRRYGRIRGACKQLARSARGEKHRARGNDEDLVQCLLTDHGPDAAICS